MASQALKLNKRDGNVGGSIDAAFGVHSTCYTMATVPGHPFCIDIPISGHIIRWNIESKQRIATFECHDAMISSIRRSPNKELTATCGYDGKLKIWDREYNLLCSATPNPNGPGLVARIDWSVDGKQLVVHCKGDESSWRKSSVVLLALSDDGLSLGLKVMSGIHGHYRMALFNAKHEILAFNTNPNLIELRSGSKMRFIGSMTSFSVDTSWTTAISRNRSGTKVAVATNQKSIVIVDAITLEMINVLKPERLTVNLWCILWSESNENDIVFQAKNGEMESWDITVDGGRLNAAWSGPSDFVYVLVESIRSKIDCKSSSRSIWFATSDAIGMNVMSAMKDNNAMKDVMVTMDSVQFHSISCCGVDLSLNEEGDSKYVAVGDLGCSLRIWSLDRCTDFNHYQPLESVQCPMSIRSLKWMPMTNLLFIGLMDGSLCWWRFDGNKKSDPRVAMQCGSGITSIESKDRVTLCVGTNGGEIFILKVINGDDDGADIAMKTLHRFMAHPPVQSDDAEYKEQFGSIHRAADIWSTHWSANGRYLATASEDQTVKIWDIDSECELIQILKGHKAAVTAVDWTVSSDYDEYQILASCSDDNTVMIWTVNKEMEWKLMHRVKPMAITGWFTLTYLRFLQSGKVIVCGTENGYIVVLRISMEYGKVEQGLTRCLHRGSVEGVAVNRKGQIVSVASDATIVLQRVSQCLKPKMMSTLQSLL